MSQTEGRTLWSSEVRVAPCFRSSKAQVGEIKTADGWGRLGRGTGDPPDPPALQTGEKTRQREAIGLMTRD